MDTVPSVLCLIFTVSRAAGVAAAATATAVAPAAAAITTSTTTARATGGNVLAPGQGTDRSLHGNGRAPFSIALGSVSMLLKKVVDVGEGSLHRPALLHARPDPLAQVGGRSRLRRVARIAEHDCTKVVPVSYAPGHAESNAVHNIRVYAPVPVFLLCSNLPAHGQK